MSNYKNIMVCNDINEEVNQKLNFTMLQDYNDAPSVIIGQCKCSGVTNSNCKYEHGFNKCGIIRIKLAEKIKQQKGIIAGNAKANEKWNF